MKNIDRRELTQRWFKLLTGSLKKGKTVELPVLSESMLPLLQPGKNIRIQRVSWRKCSRGDIIVFRSGNNLTVHRLLLRIRIGEARFFYQKGDFNPFGHIIRAQRVVGRVIECKDRNNNTVNLNSVESRRNARRIAFKQLLRAAVALFRAV